MIMEKRNLLIRLLAVLAAVAMIGGSIFAFVYPGLGKSASSFISSACADEWKTLKKGSSGAEVRKAQIALTDLGYYSGKIDGNFSKAFETCNFPLESSSLYTVWDAK